MVLVYLLRLTFKDFSRKINSPLSSVTGFSSIESGFISPASYQVFLSKTGYMTSCTLQKKQYFLPRRLPSWTSCTCSYVWYLTHVFPAFVTHCKFLAIRALWMFYNAWYYDMFSRAQDLLHIFASFASVTCFPEKTTPLFTFTLH